jgi:hypothetical protein
MELKMNSFEKSARKAEKKIDRSSRNNRRKNEVKDAFDEMYRDREADYKELALIYNDWEE